MSYTLGAPISAWGCGCVDDDSQLWLDASTGLMYVLEDAASPCSTSIQGPDDMYLPSDTKLTKDDDGTCTTLGVSGKCATLKSLSDDIYDKADKEVSINAIREVVLPLLKSALDKVGDYDKTTNLCFGDYKGSELKAGDDLMRREWSLRDSGSRLVDRNMSNSSSMLQLYGSSLTDDGCNFPPYVDTTTYSIFSFAVPMKLMNLMGCTVEAEGPATMCIAYTGCDGEPSFALQMNGATAGCVFGNDAMDISSEGLSEVFGEAISIGVDQIGFGLSLNGQFPTTFKVYDQKGTSDVTLAANVYFQAETTTDNMTFIPEVVREYLEVDGHYQAALQYGDGKVTEQIRKVFSSKKTLTAIKELTQVTVASQFKAKIKFLLSKLSTDHSAKLPDIDLGGP